MTRFYPFAACLLASAAMLGCTPDSPSMPSDTNGSATSTTAVRAQAEVGQERSVRSSSEAQRPQAPTETSTAQEQSASNKQQEIERIDFSDLNCNIQANIRFREWMLTERAKQLDGQRVRLAGYILPDLKANGIEEFVLLKNLECKFGQDGQADHLALIVMQEGETADYTSKPVDVIGTLRYKPFQGIDGNTWAIYEIEGEDVRPMRR